MIGSATIGLVISAGGIGWSLVNAEIRQEFPQVKRITTSELASWLNDPQRSPPVLLDVRTAPEFELSHLQNAERVEPDSEAAVMHLPHDRAIVTYCSVGYRSARLAERLRRAGYSDVTNLEGSIFKWANEERPLYCGARRVTEVHPYNEIWGKLLNPRHRAKATRN